MKNILSRFGKISLLLALIYFVVGCDDDKEDVAPGLYVMSDEIETFPGDTVLVSGTASNYVGLESVTLSCEQWGIHKVYELGGQKPKVFNYDYRLIVPKNASFEEYLLITIRDVDGRESKKNVLLTYVADMESPIMQTQLPSRIAVDFDAAANKGSWSLNVKFTDDRELKDIRLQIPSMQIDETVKVTGRNGELKRTIDFTTGEFPVTLTITDAGGNETVVITTVVVMLAEKEEPFEDYPVMWVVNVLLFDGLLLLPAGKRIAGKLGIFLQGFLVQDIYICLFQLALCLGCFAVRLQLVAAVALPHQISAGLHRFLGLVGAFHAHIVLFCFPDFFVELARDQMDRSFLDPLRNFGGWLFLVLKGQLRGLFSGIRVNNRLPDLFLWNIGLRLICSGRSFLRFADRLFQRRVSPFLIGKAQARFFIQTILPA